MTTPATLSVIHEYYHCACLQVSAIYVEIKVYNDKSHRNVKFNEFDKQENE
jgi:hypothetical protein